MLDHSAYPHIIDLILTLTPRCALIASVRGTSRAYRDKVDALLAHTLVVSGVLASSAPGRLPGVPKTWTVGVVHGRDESGDLGRIPLLAACGGAVLASQLDTSIPWSTTHNDTYRPRTRPTATLSDVDHQITPHLVRLLPHVRAIQADRAALYPVHPAIPALAAHFAAAKHSRLHSFLASYDAGAPVPSPILHARLYSVPSGGHELVINVLDDVMALHLAADVFALVASLFAPVLQDASTTVVLVWGAKRYEAWGPPVGGRGRAPRAADVDATEMRRQLSRTIARFVRAHRRLPFVLVGFDGCDLVKDESGGARAGAADGMANGNGHANGHAHGPDDDTDTDTDCPLQLVNFAHTRHARSEPTHNLDVTYHTRREYRSRLGLAAYVTRTRIPGDIWSYGYGVLLAGPAGDCAYTPKAGGNSTVARVLRDYCVEMGMEQHEGRLERMRVVRDGVRVGGEWRVDDMGWEHGDKVLIVEEEEV